MLNTLVFAWFKAFLCRSYHTWYMKHRADMIVFFHKITVNL
jgi:hypothetical protein